MRLAECLNSSDIQTLRAIADHYQLTCSKSSKNALMQSILTHFHHRSFIENIFSRIEEPALREIITHIILDNRSHFSREEIVALVKKIAGGDEKKEKFCLQRLMSEGWIYCFGATTKHIYYVPEDMRRKIKQQLSDMMQQELEKPLCPPVAYRDENMAIVRDTMTFLSYVAQHDCKLTQEGTLFKRHQGAILSLMEIMEQPLGQVGWRFGYGRRFREYPDRFALIYDYCYSKNLLVEDEETLTLLCTPRAKEWMAKDDREKLLDLYKFWRIQYRRPIPTLTTVLQRFTQAVRSEWVLMDSINKMLLPYVKDYYYDHKQQILEKRIYGILTHLGLICQGQLADGKTVLRLSELGREILLGETVTEEPPVHSFSSLMIQPNFDILLPAEETGRIAWDLAQFTDVCKSGVMRVHRITKHSMYRAFQEGWTAKTILSFLKEHSGDLIPSNVAKQIQTWEQEYGKIVLYRTAVIECRNRQVANELQVIPQIKEHIRGILEERYLLIPEEQLPLVTEYLQHLGYMPDLQL